MAYGKIRVDTLTWDNNGSDNDIAVSGISSAADIGVTIQAYDAATAKTDVAQTFTKAQRGAITPVTLVAANVAFDLSQSNNWSITLDRNLTVDNPSNLVMGQSGSIFLVQDGTGSRTVAWDTYWDFAGGTPPTLSTAANAVDRIDYIVRVAAGTPSIHAVATLNYS